MGLAYQLQLNNSECSSIRRYEQIVLINKRLSIDGDYQQLVDTVDGRKSVLFGLQSLEKNLKINSKRTRFPQSDVRNITTPIPVGLLAVPRTPDGVGRARRCSSAVAAGTDNFGPASPKVRG